MDDYLAKGIIRSSETMSKRIMVGIPMTGLLRAEWVLARYSQVIPCNWSQIDCLQFIDQSSPIGFVVADARNVIATKFVEEDIDWLFFIDHDTIIPQTTILTWNKRMLEGDVPIWSGLYFTRSIPSEPLIYRGRGNSYYDKWKFGEDVWVDGIPMGCTMIHKSIMKVLYDESEEYEVGGQRIRRIFDTPAKTWYDPETCSWFNSQGTEDLEWCTRIMREDIFTKAGWPEYAKKEFPFLIDTRIFCRHIDNNGVQYPARGEEQQFMEI